jgi:methionyl-tRNA formyltransferase
MRRPEDGRIDWTSPAAEIFNFVRAQSKPYPGAFTTIGGRRVKVWRARALEGACRGEPGEVVEESAEGIRVACGDGRPLLLEEIEDG